MKNRDGAMTRTDAAERPQGHEEEGKYVMSVAVRLSGVGASRIRRYETAGLVTPDRTSGGQRLFSDSDISRIREVWRLENEGVNLKGIKVIIEMRQDTD